MAHGFVQSAQAGRGQPYDTQGTSAGHGHPRRLDGQVGRGLPRRIDLLDRLDQDGVGPGQDEPVWPENGSDSLALWPSASPSGCAARRFLRSALRSRSSRLSRACWS